MATRSSEPNRIIRIVRWLAVGIGIVFVLFVIGMNIAGALPKGESAPANIWDVLKLVAMIITFAGTGLAWKWPLAGAVMMLAGYGAFESLMYAEQQRFAGGLFLLFPALAVAHIVVRLCRQKGAARS